MIIFNEKLDFLFEQLKESTKRMNKAHKLPSVNGTTENMRQKYVPAKEPFSPDKWWKNIRKKNSTKLASKAKICLKQSVQRRKIRFSPDQISKRQKWLEIVKNSNFLL